jgi:hypothetical protein
LTSRDNVRTYVPAANDPLPLLLLPPPPPPGGIGVSLPQECSAAEQVFYTWVARTRRTSSATALPRCRRLVPPCYVPEENSPRRRGRGRRRRRRRRRRKVYSKLTQ